LYEDASRGARLRRPQVAPESARIGTCELDRRAEQGEIRTSELRRRRLLQLPEKDVIGRVLRDPLAAEKGEIREVEIAYPPPEERRVERDDHRLATARLCATEQARDELVR